MSLLRPKTQTELINVHRVTADKDMLLYLKNASHDFVEGLFYQAKRYGKSEFTYAGVKYDMLRNKDFSFSVVPSEEQDLNTEEFA